MNLPPFVYSKAFWEAFSYFGAGVLALLVYFGVLSSEWAIPAAGVLSVILSVLRFVKINPELRAKGLIK